MTSPPVVDIVLGSASGGRGCTQVLQTGQEEAMFTVFRAALSHDTLVGMALLNNRAALLDVSVRVEAKYQKVLGGVCSSFSKNVPGVL